MTKLYGKQLNCITKQCTIYSNNNFEHTNIIKGFEKSNTYSSRSSIIFIPERRKIEKLIEN